MAGRTLTRAQAAPTEPRLRLSQAQLLGQKTRASTRAGASLKGSEASLGWPLSRHGRRVRPMVVIQSVFRRPGQAEATSTALARAPAPAAAAPVAAKALETQPRSTAQQHHTGAHLFVRGTAARHRGPPRFALTQRHLRLSGLCSGRATTGPPSPCRSSADPRVKFHPQRPGGAESGEAAARQAESRAKAMACPPIYQPPQQPTTLPRAPVPSWPDPALVAGDRPFTCR